MVNGLRTTGLCNTAFATQRVCACVFVCGGRGFSNLVQLCHSFLGPVL